LLGNQAFEPRVLLFQRLQAFEFVSFQAVVLVLPAIERLLADAMASTQAARGLAGGVLFYDADNLLLAEPALAQTVLLGASRPGGLS
jgi:hypothetical protein